MKKLLIALISLGLFGVAACGNGMNGRELATKTSELSADLTKQVAGSLEFLDDNELMNAFDSGLTVFDQMFVSEDGSDGGGMPLPLPSRPRDVGVDGEGSGPDQAAKDVREFLDKYVFVAENLEQDGEGRAVFLVHGSVVCVEDFVLGGSNCDISLCAPGDTLCEQEAQKAEAACQQDRDNQKAQCIENVDAVQIRIEAKEFGNGVSLNLMIGPAKSVVFTLTLQPNFVSLSMSLAGAKAALAHIMTVVDDEAVQLPEIMEGKLTISLKRNGEQDFTLSTAVDEAVHVRMSDGPDRQYDVQVAKAAPLGSVRLQGLEKKMTIAYDMNHVTVSLPFADVSETGTGAFVVDLAGLEFGFEIAASSDSIKLTGLGLGDAQSVIRHDQTVITAIDINPASNRHFNVLVTSQNGVPVFDLEPGLLVNWYVNFGHMDQFMDPVENEPAPPEMCDQTYVFDLKAEAGHFRIMPVEVANSDDYLKVLQGSVALSSSAAIESFAAIAGQCIAPTQECPEGKNPILECLAAVTCP